MRGHVADVLIDQVPAFVTGHDQRAEVFVEDVPDHADGQVRLAVEEVGSIRCLRLALDALPLGGQPGHVLGQFLLGRAFGRGAHDHARAVWHHLLEDLLQPGPLLVGQLAADTHHGRAGHVDQIAAGQAHLAGQPRSLVPDRVLGHLDQH